MNLPELRRLAETELVDVNSHPWKEKGNKYLHGQRVAELIRTLRPLVSQDASHDDVLTVAAWFHDIRNGIDGDHALEGARYVRTLLAGRCTPAELDEICGIIARHDARLEGRDAMPFPLKLHQDADLLDHFGAYDVWMSCLYAQYHQTSFEDEVAYRRGEHIEALQRHRAQIHYPFAERIFDDKAAFAQSFFERFAVEMAGGIWDAETLLA